MTSQIDKAFNESAEKSAFVCVSCGQNNIIKTRKSDVKATSQGQDRFTDAVAESSEKSAFVCESCQHVRPKS